MEAGAAERSEHGLKKDAIGFLDGLIIGIASTAPAYSLAAVLAIVVVGVGVQAPAVLLASFVPMFLIASAFYYMNRADPDCGTTFSWITRAMGPSLGWVGGWAVATTGILVIGSLAQVAAYYTFDLFGLTELRDSTLANVVFTLLIIGVMTTICVLGTELSALVQRVMILFQVGALLLFAIVALAKGGPLSFELSWLSPFAVDSSSALVIGLLTGVFIYWGWESAVNLNEETEGSATAPGLAAVLSTVILLVTYVITTVAVVAYAGLDRIAEFEDDAGIFGALATDVLGSGAGQARGDRRDPLGALVHPDHDPARVAHDPVDGAPGGVPRGVRPRAPALPDAARLDDRDRDHRLALVRGAVPAVGELRLRLAHVAGVHDRLLLLAHRVRLRDLPPARADQVGEELPVHRGRAGDRRG